MTLKVIFGFFTLVTIGLLIYLSSLFIQLNQIMLLTTSDITTTEAIHTAIVVNIFKMLSTVFVIYLVLLTMYDGYQSAKRKQANIRKLRDFADALYNKSIQKGNDVKSSVKGNPLTPKESISPDDVLNYAQNSKPVDVFKKDIVQTAVDLERRVKLALSLKPAREKYDSTQSYSDAYYQWLNRQDIDVQREIIDSQLECFKD